MFAVISLKLIPSRVACVSSNGRDVAHTVAELDECPSLDWDVEVDDVVQTHLIITFYLVSPTHSMREVLERSSPDF